jgi:acyl carrier protein
MRKADLKAVVAEIIEVEPDELDSDTDLHTIDTFDSVSVLGLIITLDEKFGVKMNSLLPRHRKTSNKSRF